MFKQIAEMLEVGSALVLTVTKEKDGRLCVQVRPVGEFKNAALGQGITFTEQAEVIDTEFGEALAAYGVAHKSLKEQVDDRVRVLAAAEQAEKAAKADAIKKAAGKATAKTVVPALQHKKPAAVAGAEPAAGQADVGDADEAGDAAEVGGDELQLF